jgi:hypothetical protein
MGRAGLRVRPRLPSSDLDPPAGHGRLRVWPQWRRIVIVRVTVGGRRWPGPHHDPSPGGHVTAFKFTVPGTSDTESGLAGDRDGTHGRDFG